MVEGGKKALGVAVAITVGACACIGVTETVNYLTVYGSQRIPTAPSTDIARRGQNITEPVTSPTQRPTPTPEILTAPLDLRAYCPIATVAGQVFRYTNLDEVWPNTYLTGVANLGPYHVCVFPNFTLVNGGDGANHLVLQQDPIISSCAQSGGSRICTENTGNGIKVTWTRRAPVPLKGDILNPAPLAPNSRYTKTPTP
ncbi:MAG: hypothetical protein WCJ70_02190 [bacterium]